MDPLDWVCEQGSCCSPLAARCQVTLIHRRVWPPLVRVADRFPAERLAAVDELHTASGAHRTIEVPFPEWIPAEVLAAAALLTVDEALALLPACLR
jgi:hypothetical protein